MKFTQKRGFTLIELLVVISIISLLTSIVLSSLSQAKKKAQGAKFVQEMNQLKIAFELYRNDKGQYPSSSNKDSVNYSVIASTLSELTSGKHIASIPKLSLCLGGCYYNGPVEDYSYDTAYKDIVGNPSTSLGGWGPCGGVYFKDYLFSVGNNQIDPNYPELDGYANYYCIGQ